MSEGESILSDITKLRNIDFGFDEKSSSYYEKGQDPPNCIGYTLYKLGLKSEEMNIDPKSPELDALVLERLERVPLLEEADAIAVVYNLPFENNQVIREYAHMAVVDKKKYGFVTERAFSGGKMRESSIEDIWKTYPSRVYGGPPEYIYFKVKPIISIQTKVST